ncbi:MAG: hypothetical protein FWF76_04005 [Oscillospiraceae bacterium]|nr:hypothetical protein [Oscillospiraceae bacterium]
MIKTDTNANNVILRISNFFQTRSERSIMFTLFGIAFILHTWLTFYINGDTPVDSQLLLEYKVMTLLLTSMLSALIVVFAFKIASILEVGRIWRRILVTLVSGFYPAIIAHTKTWYEVSGMHEVLGFLFPFVIALVLLSAVCLEHNRIRSRHFMAILLAVAMLAGMISHERMTAVSLASLITLIFARLLLKRNILPIRTFVISLIIALATLLFAEPHLARFLSLTPLDFLERFRGEYAPAFFANTSDSAFTGMNLVRAFAGHLYYFAIATRGLGIIGLCLFIIAARKLSKRVRAECQKSTLTIAELAESKKQSKFVIFTCFAFLSLLFTLILSVEGQLSTYAYWSYVGTFPPQETLIFGMYMDSIIPLILISAVCGIFVYGIGLKVILHSTVILGVIFTAFFAFTSEIVVHPSAFENASVAAILSIYPLKIAMDIDQPITFHELFLTVSLVFSFMSLLIVLMSCGGRSRIRIIAGVILCAYLYSAVYTIVVFLPYERERLQHSEPISEIVNETEAQTYEV